MVIDPVARALTHLVVEPKHGRAKGHLVPINLVVSTTDGVVLAYTTAEFEKLDEAEETQFISGGSGQSGYEQGQMLSWPYYRLGAAAACGTRGMGMTRGADRPVVVTNDRVPLGEVEVRRGEHVFATDGAIGRVRGLVILPDDHCLTHVLLDEGHLWGQKRVWHPDKCRQRCRGRRPAQPHQGRGAKPASSGGR